MRLNCLDISILPQIKPIWGVFFKQFLQMCIVHTKNLQAQFKNKLLLNSCLAVNWNRTIGPFKHFRKRETIFATNCLLVCTGFFENCKSGFSRQKRDKEDDIIL